MNILKRWILYPFLLGAYPVLALLANNLGQIIGPIYAVRPLLFALVLAGLFLLIYWLFLRDWSRSALAATLTLLLFFLYGHVFNVISQVQIAGIVISRNRYLVTLWVILLAAGLWWIARKVKTPQAWTLPLNSVSLALVVFFLIQITFFEMRSSNLMQQLQMTGSGSVASQLHPPAGKTLPDIYYIVPEDYTRADGLKQSYSYDNSAFLAALQQKGFYPINCSLSNYVFSNMSIAAAFNMQYLDTLSSRFSPPNTDQDDLDPYLDNNAVRQTLKDLGYKFISFQSGYTPTEFRDADVYLSPQTDIQNLQLFGGLTPFEALLFQTTALDALYNSHVFPRALDNTLFSAAYLLDRNRILYELNKLPEIATSIPGPKFVFVHMLGPHNPFVFGPNGEILTRNYPFTLNDDLDAMNFNDYTAGYTGEITYLNSRMLDDVSRILATSATPPIIIIQSDTGSTRIGEWVNTNLAAIYFPGAGRQNLYPSLSQVNTFRVVFNTYFGGHLDLLKDQTCSSGDHDPYRCTLKPEPDPACAKP